MSIKCENCGNFLKSKTLDESRAICIYFDGRVYPDRNAKNCKGFTRPKYNEQKKKYEPKVEDFL